MLLRHYSILTDFFKSSIFVDHGNDILDLPGEQQQQQQQTSDPSGDVADRSRTCLQVLAVQNSPTHSPSLRVRDEVMNYAQLTSNRILPGISVDELCKSWRISSRLVRARCFRMSSSINLQDFANLVRPEWPGLATDTVVLTPIDIAAGADRKRFTGAVGAAADRPLHDGVGGTTGVWNCVNSNPALWPKYVP